MTSSSKFPDLRQPLSQSLLCIFRNESWKIDCKITLTGHAVCGCPSFIESVEFSINFQSFLTDYLSHLIFIIPFPIFDCSLFIFETFIILLVKAGFTISYFHLWHFVIVVYYSTLQPRRINVLAVPKVIYSNSHI